MDELREKFLGALPYNRLVAMNVNARWGIVAGVPLVLAVLLYFVLLQSTMDDTDKTRVEIAKVMKEVQAKEELELKLPEFVKQIAELDAQVAELRKQLPEKKDIPDLLEQVSAVGLQSGLEFMVFKPSAEVEKDFYAEVPVDVTVTGTFHSVLEFFDKVSKMPRIVTFANVNFAKGGKKFKPAAGAKGMQVTAITKAITYRFLEAKVDVKSDKKEEKKEEKKPEAAKK